MAMCLAAAPLAAASDTARVDALRAAIARAVSERLDGATEVRVEITRAPDALAASDGRLVAVPAPGARLGAPSRFTITSESGTSFSVAARVAAAVPHVVARRDLPRGGALGPADVETREAELTGVPLEPLPALEDVLQSRTRRAMREGEVFSRTVLVRPYAVRAGDTVSLTIRRGPIEARGVGRAVSSGFVGDVIRIQRPGSRVLSEARVTAPAAVEILR